MLLRFGLIGLILYLLPAASNGMEQLKNYPIQGPASGEHGRSAVFEEDTVLWLYVINNGQIKKLAFSRQNLIDSPILTVEGHVNGLVLLSTSSMKAHANSNPLHVIKKNKKGYFHLKNFGYLSSDDFRSAFLFPEYQFAENTQIKGRYSLFTKVPGDALCSAPEFKLTLHGSGGSADWTIRQNAPIKLDYHHTPSAEEKKTDFYYLGTRPEQFEKSKKAFKRRAQALRAGIRMVERNIADKMVDQVRIMDYNRFYNAYTCAGDDTIWVYNRIFWKENIDELKIIAEHETLHILADQLKLPTSITMQKLFAELKENNAYSGSNPKNASVVRTNSLFDFINESNFIRGAKGGHSQDNLDEFCASFLHTLMYIDRWQDMLETPVKLPDGSFLNLSSSEQNRLSNDYKTVLNTIIQEIPEHLPRHWHTFFHARLDMINRNLALSGRLNASSGYATLVD